MDLGDRMKYYEGLTEDRVMPHVPMFARLDGKAFHTLTKKMDRPYDTFMSQLMIDVTKTLVDESHARIGYTQSDEITLMWHSDNYLSEPWLGGRVQKTCSILASIAGCHFNMVANRTKNNKLGGKDGYFDCRVWAVPNKDEAINVFLWRELDAVKNSISMAAQSVYSHKELHKKSQSDMQEMLFQKGINWNDYPPSFRRGTYINRDGFMDLDILSKIPHNDRLEIFFPKTSDSDLT